MAVTKAQSAFACTDSFQIPYLALKDLISLKTLDLESNNISVFAQNPEVRFENELNLLLSNNKIRALEASAFGSFTKLARLDLSYNQVAHLLHQGHSG